MDRLGGMMRERGLDGIALFHNYPHPLGPGGAASGFTTPFNLMGLEEKLDFVGFDIYARKELYAHVKTVVSYVVGTSRYPYIPEFIAGVWPWYLNPGDLGDEEFVTKAALMHGIKGFSRYMLVERDRWLDSPVRRDGRERADKVAVFGKVNTMLEDHGFIDFDREADVLLLANREYDRLEAAAVLVSFPGDFLETPSGFSEYAGPVTVSEDPLGFDQPIQMAKGVWFAGYSKALTSSGLGYVLSDSALAPARWAGRKVVVLTTFDYLDAGVQAALVAHAEAGNAVVIGPKVPQLDSAMRPCTLLADALGESTAHPGFSTYPVGAGQVVLVEDLTAASEAIRVAADGLRPWHANNAALDVVVHGSAKETSTKIVYVANPTDTAIEATVTLGRSVTTAHELWSDRPISPIDGAIVDTLPAYSIHVYRCAVTD